MERKIILPNYRKPKEQKNMSDLVSDIMKQPTIDTQKVYDELIVNGNVENVETEQKNISPIDRLGIV